MASVAKHVLGRLSDPGFLATVRANGQWLGERLVAFAEQSKRVRAVRGAGMMWGIGVVEPAAEGVRKGGAHKLLTLTAGDHTVR